MFGFGTDIGIDLGTANVLIYIKGKGIVLREPSVVAIDRDTNRVLAVGEEARRMIGRTPGNIVAIRPLRDGVIADYDITESMLRHFIEKVMGHSFVFRPRIMICIPSGVTKVEQRAVQEAAEQAGARHTQLIEEPLAAALGAGLDISEPCGSMVVDIGGGTTDIAVISLGGPVTSASLRVAGDLFDKSIIDYIKREFSLMIGERTAENIKINIGAAFKGAREEHMEVRGRDMLSGLPKTICVTTDQISEALHLSVTSIVDCVKKVLEETPPELAADIMDRGIVLTGGGSMLYGLAELIRRETQIPTCLADDPLSCVALGTGKALECVGKFDGIATNVHRKLK
jgi:rod shape-determining protein MreB and related proteins